MYRVHNYRTLKMASLVYHKLNKNYNINDNISLTTNHKDVINSNKISESRE